MDEQKQTDTLSRKRRIALVTYLAVLFAVAFLLVALSMLSENKKLQASKELLESEGAQNSANLTDKIEALQAENRELSDRYVALQRDLEAAQSQLVELETLRTACESLQAQLEQGGQRRLDTQKAYDLLMEALAASENNDVTLLARLMRELEPYKDLLSTAGMEIYESILID